MKNISGVQKNRNVEYIRFFNMKINEIEKMKEETKKRIEQQVTFLKNNKNKLVIDADTHITDTNKLKGKLLKKFLEIYDYYHGKPISAEELLLEMELSGVDMCLIWQNPACTLYSDDLQFNFEQLLEANRYIFETVNAYPEKFIPAGWTDPKALGIENAKKLTKICIQEFGFPIVKMNPAQNSYPIDSEMVIDVLKYIVELKAVPAFHYGADTPYTPPGGLENLLKKFTETPILAVHMGGGGAAFIDAEETYNQSRKLGLQYPNLKYILSAKRDTHIESDIIAYQLHGAPQSGNLFCASDAPYGKQTWNFGGFRAMLQSFTENKTHTDNRVNQNKEKFDKAMIQNYLGENFANFIIQAYNNLSENI